MTSELTYILPASTSFVVQPACGELNPDIRRYPITWEISFVPYKVEVCRKYYDSYYQTHETVVATLETGLTKRRTYWIDGCYGGDQVFIKAYYGAGKNDCVTSELTYIFPHTMTITFDPNGGECDVTEAETGLDGKLTSLPTATRAGYTFYGWYWIDGEANQPVHADTVYYTDTQLHAHWIPQYHNVLVLDGTAGVTRAYTGQLNLTLKANEKAGMRFYRWVVKSGEAQIYNAYNPDSGFTMGPEDVTIQATYKYIPVTVTFDPNGGTCDVASAQTGTDGKLSSLPVPTRDGYNFAYWCRDTASGGTSVVTSDTALTQDTTVRAVWSGVWHTVTVQDGTADYSAAPASQTVTITANSRDNFTFSHWEAVSGNVTFADPDSATTTFVMGIEPVTVRAEYTYSGEQMTELYVYVAEPEVGGHPAAPVVTTDAYNVNNYVWYDVAEDNQLAETDVFENGKTYRLDIYLRITDTALIFDPSVTGYVNDSADGVTTTYQTYFQTRIEKTFTAADYTVSFDANGGTGEMAAVTGVGLTYTLPECGFTPPENFVFNGWDCGQPGEIVAMTADRTLTAQWRQVGGPCGANAAWRLYDDGTLVISGTGAMTDFSFANRPDWYDQRLSVKAVIAEDGITSVGSYSFQNCVNLESVFISGSVKTVKTFAFASCATLSSVTLEEGVNQLDNSSFAQCAALTDVTLPESMTTLWDQVFRSCSNLAYLTVLNPDTVIPAAVLQNVPNTLTIRGYVGSTAEARANAKGCNFEPFPNGSLGENVIFNLSPSGALTISGTGPMYDYANASDSPLYALREQIFTARIADGVTSIGKHVFASCAAMTEVAIADTVSALGDNAFLDCALLDHVRIPYGVTEIQGFRGCASLSDISLPYSVIIIRMNAFYGCTALTDLDFIPESVQYIRSYAFAGCKGLTSVFFPRNVTAIEANVFCSCSNMTSIAIHHDVVHVMDNAFYGATSLSSVFYEGVRSEWDAINIAAQGNTKLLNATVYCKSAVVFDSLGGTAVSMQALDYEECALEPADPIRYGYLFGGWYTDADCAGEPYDFSTTVTGDITLYARWIDPEPAGMIRLPASLTAIEEDAFAGISAQAVVFPNAGVTISGNPFAESGVQYIYGYPGSTAQTVSDTLGMTFVPIDDNWLESH